MSKLRKVRPKRDGDSSAGSSPMLRHIQSEISCHLQSSAGNTAVGFALNRRGQELQTTYATSEGQRPLPSVIQPRSATEQYWAARAITAETLLSARIDHHVELQRLSLSEEVKRSRELLAASKTSELRHARLEKIILTMFATLVAFGFFVTYRLTHAHHKSSPAKWSIPSHFTIPVLSPFTSVVEHDTSVFGFRSISVFIVVLGIVAYFILKHWLNTRCLHR